MLPLDGELPLRLPLRRLRLPRSRSNVDSRPEERRESASAASAVQPEMPEATARELRRLLAEALVSDYRQQNQADSETTSATVDRLGRKPGGAK
jgi:hypothetical protein